MIIDSNHMTWTYDTVCSICGKKIEPNSEVIPIIGKPTDPNTFYHLQPKYAHKECYMTNFMMREKLNSILHYTELSQEEYCNVCGKVIENKPESLVVLAWNGKSVTITTSMFYDKLKDISDHTTMLVMHPDCDVQVHGENYPELELETCSICNEIVYPWDKSHTCDTEDVVYVVIVRSQKMNNVSKVFKTLDSAKEYIMNMTPSVVEITNVVNSPTNKHLCAVASCDGNLVCIEKRPLE